jgi:hypothetical protein
VHRRALPPQPLAIKPSPFDACVADVDQKDAHDGTFTTG